MHVSVNINKQIYIYVFQSGSGEVIILRYFEPLAFEIITGL